MRPAVSPVLESSTGHLAGKAVMRIDQQIRFLTTPDGARIAYSAVGNGLPIVRTPPWLSHLDLEWKIPAVREFYERMAKRHTVVRYDSLGYGLSDWARQDFSIAQEVTLLELLVDNLDLERFALFGFGAGGPIAVSYAAAHPERVSNLILFGTLGDSRHARLSEEMPEALQALAIDHWPLAARLFADLLAPDADGAMLQTLANMYVQSSTGENLIKAVHGLLHGADLLEVLPGLTVPTTVIHRVGDTALPYQAGRELAARIPMSCFVPLEGRCHLPFLGNSELVLAAIARALGDDASEEEANGYAEDFAASDRNGHENGSGNAAVAAGQTEVASINEAVFRREGEYWTISFGSQTFRLRDSRGLRYIAQLLRYPGREFHVNELEVRSETADSSLGIARSSSDVSEEELADAGLHSDSSGDAGEMLDVHAKQAYRRRLQELRENLEGAKTAGDANRADEIEEEIAFLTRELSRAVGLGGRDRRAASVAQRSRINVTRAIRRTIEKMRPHSPTLAGLLARRIKTGLLCVYRPDERVPVAWNL
jgi:pimeloyl-ACP methyl ester carboxylesterase